MNKANPAVISITSYEISKSFIPFVKEPKAFKAY